MKTLGWKEIALVVVAVVFNAVLLTQLVSGTDSQRVSAAFAQPYEDGQTCVDPADCISGNCVDDVCCDTACNQPNQSCNQPGNVGTCVGTAAAPALSFPLQWFAAGLVSLIAILRLRRRFQ